MTATHRAATSNPLSIKDFPAPNWMTRPEKKLFRVLISQCLDAKCEPTNAEQSKIADYIAIRGRIETMRFLLAKDEREIESGGQSTVTKARILQLARQMDAAEKQSHQLAADLGLI